MIHDSEPRDVQMDDQRYPASCAADAEQFVSGVIHARQNTAPRRLHAPGPSGTQLRELLRAAAAAPDHARLNPWRFLLIPEDRRVDLAQAFRDALSERDSEATANQLDATAEKATRSPMLLLAVADMSQRQPAIAGPERLVSLGCAIQNMLLLASAMGFGSGLSSGGALQSRALRETFGILTEEIAVCFISFGTVDVNKPARARSETAAFFSVYTGAQRQCPDSTATHSQAIF